MSITAITVDDKFDIRVGLVIRLSKPKPSSKSFNILHSLLFVSGLLRLRSPARTGVCFCISAHMNKELSLPSLAMKISFGFAYFNSSVDVINLR